MPGTNGRSGVSEGSATGGQTYSVTEAFAALTGEPLLMRPWEIGRLTPYQVLRLINHPRDDSGQILVSDKTPRRHTFQEQFFRSRRLWNMPEWRIDEQWQEWQKQQEQMDHGGDGWGQ